MYTRITHMKIYTSREEVLRNGSERDMHVQYIRVFVRSVCVCVSALHAIFHVQEHKFAVISMYLSMREQERKSERERERPRCHLPQRYLEITVT